jgi:hydrogenase expression/formation protein HypE
MRDPTRGGLATVLNEIASQSSVGILIEEAKIPLKEAVIGACELFGFDPLYLANEGKMVAFVRESDAEQALEALKSHPLGRDAMIIGEVVDNHPSKVVLATLMGGRRLVDRLTGDMLPRIC